jgi:hypothetical protein
MLQDRRHRHKERHANMKCLVYFWPCLRFPPPDKSVVQGRAVLVIYLVTIVASLLRTAGVVSPEA